MAAVASFCAHRGLARRARLHFCCRPDSSPSVPDHTVHVVSDATSSRKEENWKVALERMRQAGVVVTSTEMVIYELLQRAGTDEFRATLPLVK